MRARRHAERLTGLDEAELAAFARRARDLVASVTAVTGAPATYLLVFGENYPHFHALIAVRGEHVPEQFRAGNITRHGRHMLTARAAASIRAARADPGPLTPPRQPGTSAGLCLLHVL